MDNTELRIGNLVKTGSGIERVHSIYFDFDEGVQMINDLNESFVSPIPITKDILRCFGFEKRKNYRKVYSGESKLSWFIDNIEFLRVMRVDNDFVDNCNIEYGGVDDFEPWSVWFCYDRNHIHINYVHQLQNIYYQLNIEELKYINV